MQEHPCPRQPLQPHHAAAHAAGRPCGSAHGPACQCGGSSCHAPATHCQEKQTAPVGSTVSAGGPCLPAPLLAPRGFCSTAREGLDHNFCEGPFAASPLWYPGGSQVCFIPSEHHFVWELVAGEDAAWEAQALFIHLLCCCNYLGPCSHDDLKK